MAPEVVAATRSRGDNAGIALEGRKNSLLGTEGIPASATAAPKPNARGALPRPSKEAKEGTRGAGGRSVLDGRGPI
jgi:hypothetical protein